MSSLLLLDSPRPLPGRVACELRIEINRGIFVLLCSRRAKLAVVATTIAVGALLTLGEFPAAYAVPPKPVKPASPAPIPSRYIVTLTDKPVATYDGDVKGLGSTRPSKGARVNVTSGRAKRYRAYLEKQQENAAARVGARPLKHYAVSLNGFATTLTPDQARTLQREPGVLAVTKDLPRKLTDNKNPVDFLKLSGSNGVWAALGGKENAGRGVVVGVVDSGYWPASKSFAGDPLGTAPPTSSDPFRPYRSSSNKIVMHKADGHSFTGTCQAGDSFTGDECNTKIIGARYFSSTYESQTPRGAAYRLSLAARRLRPRHSCGIDRRWQCRGVRIGRRPLLRKDLRNCTGSQAGHLQGRIHQRDRPGSCDLRRRCAGCHRRRNFRWR